MIWEGLFEQRASEFEIQASLYCALTELDGIIVRGEMYVKCQQVSGLRKRNRLDIVVFSLAGEPLVIIEAKRGERGGFRGGGKSKQIMRYEEYGIPVLVCRTMRDVEPVFDLVKKMLAEQKK